MQTDRKDRRILRELQLNGRLTNQALARRVNLSPSPCLRRVQRLEEQGIIQGYTAIVSQHASGFPITVFVQVELERHDTETVSVFEQRVKEIDQIMDCFLMTGQRDYMLRVLAASLEDYERFVRETLHTIPGIASMNTSFAFGVVKQQRVLPSEP